MKRQTRRFRKAVDLWQQHPAPTPHMKAIALNNLAQTYRRQKRYDEAAPLFLQARQLLEEVRGRPRRELASPGESCRGFQAETGHYPLAVATFSHAIELSVETRGEDNPDVALLRLEFAALRRAQGHYVESVDLSRRPCRCWPTPSARKTRGCSSRQADYKRCLKEAQAHVVMMK
ncbi:MAG: tetratricopeptide repeat protein [Paludibaculum sp.]